MIELKPCPRCGSPAFTELVEDPAEYIVYCSKYTCDQPCASAFMTDATPEDVAAIWNRSTPSGNPGE